MSRDQRREDKDPATSELLFEQRFLKKTLMHIDIMNAEGKGQ